MDEANTLPENKALLPGKRPWAFSTAELTAGLRKYTGDPSLKISALADGDIPNQRPGVGRLRGLRIAAHGQSGEHNFNLVLKEPQGGTRAGTAGVGLREVSVYTDLAEHLPLRIPQLIASHPKGHWLIIQQLEAGKPAESWTAEDYLLSIDLLADLHDRFWGMGEFLNLYTWLSKPLDMDADIHLQASTSGAVQFANSPNTGALYQDAGLISAIPCIIENYSDIITHLSSIPKTLLHGDFWPGNIHLHSDSTLSVFDWEMASVGPGVLDLLGFIQSASWQFEQLPVTADDLISRYRSRLADSGVSKQDDDSWQIAWDNAVMWTFVTGWVELLAQVHPSIIKTRMAALNAVIFEPVKQAVSRRL